MGGSKKGIIKDNKSIHNENLSSEFKKRVEKFERYYDDPEQHHKIYEELGFMYVDDGCDGFCPECEKMLKCEIYKEIKDDWERFYS